MFYFQNSVPESIGHLHKILVWHNNGGISPSWYLSRVAVRDLITGHKWYFICERWFAVEEDDGKIERAIDALEEGVGFQKVGGVAKSLGKLLNWATFEERVSRGILYVNVGLHWTKK